MKLEWKFFKSMVQSRSLDIQYEDLIDRYALWACVSTMGFECVVFKKTKHGEDFENNFKSISNRSPEILVRTSNVSTDEYERVRHKGDLINLKGQVAAGGTKNFDWQIEQLQYFGVDKPSFMTGLKYNVDGGNWDDTISLSIVDKDGTGVSLGFYDQAYYDANGPEITVDEFGDCFPVFPLESIREHRANLIPGLYLRVHYKCGQGNAANFICGLFRYLNTK